VPAAVDERAVLGAGNNGDLYEAVFAAHGLAFERLPFAFVARDRPPPYYGNLTVLSPGHADEVTVELADLAMKSGGALGVKDSFGELELGGNGFEVLFGASWIWRAPGARAAPSGWRAVTEPDDLALWEAGWKAAGSPADGRMFGETLLRSGRLSFLGVKREDGFVAGCIACRSGACLGVSNVFSTDGDAKVFAQAADAVAALDGSLPLVGYESGDALDDARRAGFEAVGDLRVLVSEVAVF
jgi:hypothetical protein